jgi:hypothetical protein
VASHLRSFGLAEIIEAGGTCIMAKKEQRKVQKAVPKSNKQKKEMQKEKKAAKANSSGISLKKE